VDRTELGQMCFGGFIFVSVGGWGDVYCVGVHRLDSSTVLG